MVHSRDLFKIVEQTVGIIYQPKWFRLVWNNLFSSKNQKIYEMEKNYVIYRGARNGPYGPFSFNKKN